MGKWIAIGLLVVFIAVIASGYKGGAKDATSNYHSVMRGG